MLAHQDKQLTVTGETLEQRERRLLRDGGWKGSKTPGAPQISARVAYMSDYPKTSCTLPMYCDGAEHIKTGPHAGRAIIKNYRHEQDLCRMHGYANKFEQPPE